MKFFITFLLFILTFGTTFAGSGFYSKLNIFENYLQNQKLSLEKIIKKYDIKNSIKLNNSIKDISKIINIIEEVKKENLSENYEKIILNSIKDKVNSINYNTKKYLKSEIYKYEKSLKKEKIYYENISKKLEKSLEKIIKNTYKLKFKNNNKLTKKEENLANNLLELKKQAFNLKNFSNANFKSKKNMKNTFLNILINIKKTIHNLKENL